MPFLPNRLQKYKFSLILVLKLILNLCEMILIFCKGFMFFKVVAILSCQKGVFLRSRMVVLL